MFRYSKLVAISLALTFGLAACGGGGGGGGAGVTGPSYSGSTSPATIDSANAEEVSTAAADAASKSVNNQTAGSSGLFAAVIETESDLPTAEMTNLSAEIVRQAWANLSQAQNTLLGAIITWQDLNAETGTTDFCGGSITVPDNVNTSGSTFDVTMTFNSLCFDNGIDPQVVISGTIRLIETNTSVTVIFSNVSMTVDGGPTYTLNVRSTCDAVGNNCTVDFEGSDGDTYRMGNLTVSGNDVSGYSVSGTFYHPDHGSVSLFTTTSMTFNCAPESQPDTGELGFTGDSGTSGRIVFQGCSDYTYCFSDGVGPEVCTPGTW